LLFNEFTFSAKFPFPDKSRFALTTSSLAAPAVLTFHLLRHIRRTAENYILPREKPAIHSEVMQAELIRAPLAPKSDPAPYFVSYTVNDQEIVVLVDPPQLAH